MNLKERFLNKLQGKEVDVTPIGCTTTYGVVDLMTKCGYERPLADTDPKAMTELAYAGYQYAGFEWVKAMGWDIAALSEALGCELGTPKIDRQFYINSFPYADGVDNLEFPSDFLSRGRLPAFKENIKLLKERAGDRMAVFGETEGAFTCAANLVGPEQFIKWAIKKPDLLAKTLDVTKQAAIAAANFAFDNGVDFFVFAEPTSGPALLNPRLYEKLVMPVEKRSSARSRVR